MSSISDHSRSRSLTILKIRASVENMGLNLEKCHFFLRILKINVTICNEILEIIF
ncbi:hypothetical protein CKA32_006534 [Geitlerinema sp. FC II]|nr:hypothetical protein CKA32_006534 [Geitlerinema sp. FC II]